MRTLKSQQQLYDEFIAELQSQAPDMTDVSEGSLNDIIAGTVSAGMSELSRITVDEFAKTFFDTAHGPEITGGPDDLQTLAVDHFGADFARPAATKSEGTIFFARPGTTAGAVLIPAGTIVKTPPDANGNVQRFSTLSDVTLTGLSIAASAEAVEAGAAGNVLPYTVTVLESALTDPSIAVTNPDVFSGGQEVQTDAEYRETIRNKILGLIGATIPAIEAAALTVPGVVKATAIETELPVIPYDIAAGAPVSGSSYFLIPYTDLYVADINGSASAALIAEVQAAVDQTRAAGVSIQIHGATPLLIDWTGTIVLNPSGPNFAQLSTNPQKLIDSMRKYIADLPTGSSFVRATANAAMLAIWGASGSNDLTSFATTYPIGDIAAQVNQKPIPHTVTLV